MAKLIETEVRFLYLFNIFLLSFQSKYHELNDLYTTSQQLISFSNMNE